MISVKRGRKRSLRPSAPRHWLIIGLVVAALVIAMGIFGLSKSLRLEDRLDDLADYMAISIRTDLNQVLQSYDTMDRRSADLSGEVIPNMKRYMYSAYNMNRLLVTAQGERYSIIDSASYNSFQNIMGEYEKLLKNGQNTSEVAATLNDYMASMRTMLGERFDSAGALLPQTASKAVRP